MKKRKKKKVLADYANRMIHGSAHIKIRRRYDNGKL